MGRLGEAELEANQEKDPRSTPDIERPGFQEICPKALPPKRSTEANPEEVPYTPNSIDSFVMLADAFVRAHAGAINVETRKSDLFKVKQRDNEMLREFVSRFQMK